MARVIIAVVLIAAAGCSGTSTGTTTAVVQGTGGGASSSSSSSSSAMSASSSSSSSGGGMGSGTLSGMTAFTVKQARVFRDSSNAQFQIENSESDFLCHTGYAGTGVDYVQINLNAPAALGDYPLGEVGGTAAWLVRQLGGSPDGGHPITISMGTAGTVTLTSVSDTSVAGAFNASMTDDSTLAGSFTAVPCP